MRLSQLLQQAIIALTLNTTTAAVSAVTLGFEELTPTASACSGALPTTRVETRGFVFEVPDSGLDVCASGATDRADNGGNYLGLTTRVELAHGGRLPFFLEGLDASVFTDPSKPRTIMISGVPSRGVGSDTFTMPLIPADLAFQSVDLPVDFTRIAFISVELVGLGPGFPFDDAEDVIAVDNLQLRVDAPAGIPEPSTFALVAFALLGWRASRALVHSLI